MRLAPALIVASIALFTVVHAAPHAATRQTTTSPEEPLASLQSRKAKPKPRPKPLVPRPSPGSQRHP
ncbi:uncharacterized protein C8R40DRAFT_1173799 [Lentinula edodes]|uniref:uncharacterized protein n=1 Tax=Lentinula edodes TaxID=5353 RepID=UPI001BF7F9FD|nr:uncharacterized protein C8R40DRAFT_1173799 [Lentinula edodes]KAF8828042.1 hypothetical protein HHX47_DHR4000474 [Lentinula edodes]KAH7872400.1 hypothetical protein C8R40DRAFT_1173799 [Lentinula edodes]